MDDFVNICEILKKSDEASKKHEILVGMITEVAEVRRVTKREGEKIAKLQQEVARLREEHGNLKIDARLARGALESKRKVLGDVESVSRRSEESLCETHADFARSIGEYNERIEEGRVEFRALGDEEGGILERTRRLHEENHQMELKCAELQGRIDATQVFVEYQDRRTNNLKKFLDEISEEMAADTDSEMKNLGAPLGAQAGVENYRKLVQTYLNLHLYQAALFWADKVVALTAGSPKDVYWLAQCMFLQKQYHRAAHLLRSRELEKSYVLCNSLTARCLLEANELKEALDVIKLMDLEVFLQNSTTSSFSTNIENGMFDETPKFQVQSSVLLLKGKIYEAMDNRGLASDCYRQALQSDVHCYEAFECLIQHNMLTAAEEIELINGLPISEQCTTEESEILLLLYRSKLKKYHTPADIVEPKNMICIPKQYNSTPHPESEHTTTPLLEGKKLDRKRSSEKMSVDSLNAVTLQRLQASLDVVVSKAEQMYYNCDYQKCIGLTEVILKQDPYHSACLPIHISCLVELKQSNKLFTLAHNLVDLYPNLAISWFAVGCYYYIIGKSDYARRYLAKATTLDRLFGPAWLAYGHSFAIENEHDQAMAAYFKASQLMKGCHLPLMYIGLECGLTNNAPLAEKFFQQANKIAPDDPFVLHEMGVIAFQNLDYSFAEMHFKEALKIIKSRKNTIMPERWAPLYNNLGHALRKQKKFKPALLYHHEALVLMPQCASTYSAIAYVHALMNNLEDAVDWFHRALGLKRDDTFSTTMLNYVIEQLSEEQPPYPDAPDNIPAFVKQDDSTAQDVGQDEGEASVELSTINETAEMSMSLEMDITDANATPKD